MSYPDFSDSAPSLAASACGGAGDPGRADGPHDGAGSRYIAGILDGAQRCASCEAYLPSGEVVTVDLQAPGYRVEVYLARVDQRLLGAVLCSSVCRRAWERAHP